MAGYMNNGYGGYTSTPYYNPLQPQMDRLAQMQAQYQLSNAAQTTNIVNALRPTPVPSYPVMSPYTSIINPTGFTFGVNGCGCNTCGC